MIGLSFLIEDQENGEVIFFHEKTFSHSTTPEELFFDIENVFAENDIFQQDFEEVAIVYSTSLYSLVPSSLFDETKASEYLKFNSKILANDYISHDIIEDLVIVYVPYMNINNYFFEKFGSFEYFHATSILLKMILGKEKHSSDQKVYLHLHENQFDCIVIRNGELELCNTYSYKTPEDFIYYTLFCLEQLKLNPEKIQVVLSGDIKEGDSNYNMAYTYIRNIKFMEVDSSAIQIDEQLPHQKIILKNLL